MAAFWDVLFLPNPFDPQTISRIIGDIVVEHSDKVISCPIFFNGKTTKSDLSHGFFSLPCSGCKANEPLFLLVSTGTYSTKRKENFQDQCFEIDTIKLGDNSKKRKKSFRFFILRINDSSLEVEENNQFLIDCAYEVPSDKTIILGINPKYFSSLRLTKKKALEQNGILRIPTIVLKKTVIHQNYPVVEKKFLVRKIKAKSYHDTAIHYQNTKSAKNKGLVKISKVID